MHILQLRIVHAMLPWDKYVFDAMNSAKLAAGLSTSLAAAANSQLWAAAFGTSGALVWGERKWTAICVRG